MNPVTRFQYPVAGDLKTPIEVYMEELERLEEQVSMLIQAYDAIQGVVEEMDLQHFECLEEAMDLLLRIRKEVEEEDIPKARDSAYQEYRADRAELQSTYRQQQGF